MLPLKFYIYFLNFQESFILLSLPNGDRATCTVLFLQSVLNTSGDWYLFIKLFSLKNELAFFNIHFIYNFISFKYLRFKYFLLFFPGDTRRHPPELFQLWRHQTPANEAKPHHEHIGEVVLPCYQPWCVLSVRSPFERTLSNVWKTVDPMVCAIQPRSFSLQNWIICETGKPAVTKFRVLWDIRS